MNINKPRRQTKRRNRNKRRNFARPRNFQIARETFMSADSTDVRLRYAEYVTRAPAAIFDEYVFTGNGPFDPNSTGTGGQPVAYDQWSSQYSRQRTISSVIKVEFTSESTSVGGVYFSIFPSTTSGGATSLQDAVCQKYSVYKNCGNDGSHNIVTLRNKMTTTKMWGQPIMQDDLFGSTVSALPNNLWYWIINAYSTNNVVYSMLVTITYHIRFYRRFPFDLSVLSVKKILPDDEKEEKRDDFISVKTITK